MPLAALRHAAELVDDCRARLALNVMEDLACEALSFRLERLLAASRRARSRIPAADRARGRRGRLASSA